MARGKTPANGKKDTSTAAIGFEVTALRGRAFPPREATLRNLSAAKDNRWLTADMADYVLANGPDGSGSSNQSGEGDTRAVVADFAAAQIERRLNT